jgi:hypothetical protein
VCTSRTHPTSAGYCLPPSNALHAAWPEPLPLFCTQGFPKARRGVDVRRTVERAFGIERSGGRSDQVLQRECFSPPCRSRLEQQQMVERAAAPMLSYASPCRSDNRRPEAHSGLDVRSVQTIYSRSSRPEAKAWPGPRQKPRAEGRLERGCGQTKAGAGPPEQTAPVPPLSVVSTATNASVPSGRRGPNNPAAPSRLQCTRMRSNCQALQAQRPSISSGNIMCAMERTSSATPAHRSRTLHRDLIRERLAVGT